MAANYTITVEQATDFKLRLYLTSPTGLDFTGSTAAGQIRKTYSDSTVIAAFTCTSGTDTTGFYFDFTISKTLTAAIPVDAAVNYKKKVTNYCYDLDVTLAGGQTIRLLEGTAAISPTVTR